MHGGGQELPTSGKYHSPSMVLREHGEPFKIISRGSTKYYGAYIKGFSREGGSSEICTSRTPSNKYGPLMESIRDIPSPIMGYFLNV
jgi:hypothetical protein